MQINMTKADLIAFEEDIKQEFLAGKIRAPIHLSGGNENELIDIFQHIQPEDWLFTTYRNHYHALLKGVPPAELKEAIMDGRSMYYCDKERKILSSAIVAGMLPVAVGCALGLKRLGSSEKVWCFVGDMAAETGTFLECTKYAGRHGLPIIFVVEDNGLSTNTPTQEVWGLEYLGVHFPYAIGNDMGATVWYYRYTRTVPHVGAGQFVVFS